MILRIGTTEIEITSCERMRDLQKGFFLDIQIPKENISSDDLEALLDGCTEPIIVTEDDGSETEYMGFNECASIMTKNGVRSVAQYSTSEAMAQLSLARKKIANQDAIIAAQTERATSLEEMSMAQLSAIDSILTEVVPAVIDLAVSQAIEAVTQTTGE